MQVINARPLVVGLSFLLYMYINVQLCYRTMRYHTWVFFLLTGTEWPLMVATVLELRWKRPSLGPNIIAPIRAAIPPSTWTTPLPAKSCQKRERYRRSGVLLGGGEVLLFFILFFFCENDRHLLHYIEQVHPEEIEAWYNSNCSLCILGIIKLCLLTWKIRFHFALGWELSYTKLYIERKMLNQEKNTLLA